MRIIFVLRSLTLSGGIERVFVDKANWLANHGHSVLFLTFEQGTHPLSFQLDDGVGYEDLDCRYFRVYRYGILKRIIQMYLIKRQFRKRLQQKIEYFKPTAVVVPHNLTEYYGCLISLCSSAPIVVENHSAYTEFMNPGNSLKQKIHQHNYKVLVKRCRLVLSLTDKDADFWRSFNHSVQVAPNPITFYPDQIEETERKNRIICVGRLSRVKRWDRLVDAFSLISDKYPRWHVAIFGEGEEKDSLNEQICHLGLKGRITICSPTKEIYQEYFQSQFLVLSSDSEGFSLVLAEAMACGLPVVSTDCPFGPSEIIDDGTTGLLSKMDVNDLAEKMEWMITHEKERKQMGEKAHAAAAKYKKGVIMKQWEQAYLSVL